jgi:hypothetical protein
MLHDARHAVVPQGDDIVDRHAYRNHSTWIRQALFMCCFYCKTLTQHDREYYPPDSTQRRFRWLRVQSDRGKVDFASIDVLDGLQTISAIKIFTKRDLNLKVKIFEVK